MGARPSSWKIATAAAMLIGGCASGSGVGDSGSGTPDSGASDGGGTDAGTRDAGTRDAGDAAVTPDGGDLCGGTSCDPFQYCDGGRCRDYPACAGDGSCPRPGDVCHNRRCVPGTVDIDGDGSPASADCDETNPLRHPGATEVCSTIDEDCDGTIDEGDPATLCASSEFGGICIDHVCGCPEGTFDFERAVPGCECTATPTVDQGTACDQALDLGDLADTGMMLTVNGNALPPEREVWYRFRGVDGADTACDNYHVRALLLDNPDSTFELTVSRGTCASAECTGTGIVDYRWATDFRATIDGRATGQCPCTTTTALSTGVSVCGDDTAEYFVRVRRRAGATLGCQSYTLELSNGLYDTP